MRKPRLCWIAPLACLALAACDDEPGSKPRPRFDADSGTDAGPNEDSHAPAYAVISSDFAATSISLLAADGDILADDYLNSGSTETGLVTALSGDVELPTRSGEHGVMVLLDRFKTDVVTRVELSSGDVLGQVQVRAAAADGDDAFSANPRDYLRIDATTAWVVRSEPNLKPGAAENNLGNDLLRIDPNTMERTDDRIDLSALNGRASRTDPMTGTAEEVDVYARPGRLVRIGDTLIVGLARSAFDFSATGSGMVAVVNLKTKAVVGFEIEDLQGCSQVSAIPGASDRVLVGCGGVYPTPRDSAGLAILRVSSGKASLVRSWKAKDHEDAPAISEGYVAIDANTVGGSLNGFVPGDDDSVFGLVDLESGEFTKLASTPAGGTFGTPLYDAESGKLFLPDSSVDGDLKPTAGVRVLERSDDGSFEDSTILEVAKDTGLPARHVFRL